MIRTYLFKRMGDYEAFSAVELELSCVDWMANCRPASSFVNINKTNLLHSKLHSSFQVHKQFFIFLFSFDVNFSILSFWPIGFVNALELCSFREQRVERGCACTLFELFSLVFFFDWLEKMQLQTGKKLLENLHVQMVPFCTRMFCWFQKISLKRNFD